jgi:hypothetical protein
MTNHYNYVYIGSMLEKYRAARSAMLYLFIEDLTWKAPFGEGAFFLQYLLKTKTLCILTDVFQQLLWSNRHRGRGSISKVEGHWPKGAFLYMTKIKRFYDVHEPNEIFWKYGVSITSEMAFTESLLLRKGHFLSEKEGVYSRNTFFVL